MPVTQQEHEKGDENKAGLEYEAQGGEHAKTFAAQAEEKIEVRAYFCARCIASSHAACTSAQFSSSTMSTVLEPLPYSPCLRQVTGAL